MDSSYLLFLQNLRHAIGDALTPLMQWLSPIVLQTLMLIPVFMYWCADKKSGLRILASIRLSGALNSFIKLNAGVDRPWVRDPRIVPAGDAMTTNSDYSFPSTETTTATPVYGGLWAWLRNRWRPAAWLSAFMLLLTGFSRNYLGINSLTDVLGGFLLGLACIWAVSRLSAYFDAHPEKENAFLLGGFVLGVLMLVFLTYRTYPLKLAGGKPIADLTKMIDEAWSEIGGLLAFFAARFVEKRWIRFRAPGYSKKSFFICLLGLLPLYLTASYLKTFFVGQCGPLAGNLIHNALRDFYSVAGFPIVLALCFGREEVARND